MAHDVLRERERALEETFFARENARLLERLRSVRLAEMQKRDLREQTGIRDDAVLDQLVEAGVGTEMLAAFSLVPLVRMAWATGRVQGPEREAVLRAAVEKGLPKHGPAYEMLERWLHEHPARHLYDTWAAYARALASTLDEEGRKALQRDVLARSRAVAEAARNFAGIGPKISPEEEDVLREIESALSV